MTAAELRALVELLQAAAVRADRSGLHGLGSSLVEAGECAELWADVVEAEGPGRCDL